MDMLEREKALRPAVERLESLLLDKMTAAFRIVAV